ncbi:MAG: hypothetical protein KDA63_21370 [Planctomycetales bacterium]|nr:hypothetical protein [Planctomycetales bacterium]
MMRRIVEPFTKALARRSIRWAVLGGVIGASLPLSFVAASLYAHWLQEVPPGTVNCGTPVLASLLLAALCAPPAGIGFAAVGAWLGTTRE